MACGNTLKATLSNMVPWLTSCRSETEQTPEPTDKRPPVGYIIAMRTGPEGRQGVGYDYVIARGGVYVQSENDLLTARIRISPANIRGLAEVEKN